MASQQTASVVSMLANHRLNSISILAQAWLNPRTRWRRKAIKEIAAHSFYSEKMVEACLETVFKNYTSEHLLGWAKTVFTNRDHHPHGRERDSFSLNETVRIRRSVESQVLVILPSTVFACAWQSAAAVWLAGKELVLKPSRSELKFAVWLQRSIRMLKLALPIKIISKITHFDYDTVIAYGQDSTLREIRSKIPQSTRFIKFGSRISIGIMDAPRSNPLMKIRGGLERHAARDVALYDAQGCLSPQCFFVSEQQADAFAQKLAKELLRLESVLFMKRRESDLFEGEGFWQKWRFRESQGKCRIYSSRVILQKEGVLEPSGLRRVVFVIPFKKQNEIFQCLGKWKDCISTIAVAPFDFTIPIHSLEVRYCRMGEMHQPLPSWKNGGIDLLKRLL